MHDASCEPTVFRALFRLFTLCWCVSSNVSSRSQSRLRFTHLASCESASLLLADGNNDGPVDCGPIGEGTFLEAAVRHIKLAYIEPFPDSHFSLITLGPKKAE